MSSPTSVRAWAVTLAVNDFRVWPASALRATALMMLPTGPNQRLPSPKDWMSVPCGARTVLTAAGEYVPVMLLKLGYQV